MNIASKNLKPVLVLFGPTAVGKTGLIADLFDGAGEVINADSMQVYRGMDVGTAKPSEELRYRVPHHLIDIRNPDEPYDVGDFVRAAQMLVEEILLRGKIPVVSGGTAFYLKHFIFGLPEAPKADPRVRAALKEELKIRGEEELFRELQQVDPVSAGRIAPGDTYRVLRAIEVFRTAGKPLSDYSTFSSPRKDMNLRIVGLYRDREELNMRIDARVDEMFSSGLVEEVKDLIGRGFDRSDPGMRGIGYREFFIMREAGCMSMDDVKKLIQRNSRRYAKRQMTFFRSIPGVRWVNPEDRISFQNYFFSP